MVRRYIRLTFLIPELLKLVDNTKANEHSEKEKKQRRLDHLTGLLNSYGFFEKVIGLITKGYSWLLKKSLNTLYVSHLL